MLKMRGSYECSLLVDFHDLVGGRGDEVAICENSCGESRSGKGGGCRGTASRAWAELTTYGPRGPVRLH